MSDFIRDSWDFYATYADCALNKWTSSGGGFSLSATTRFCTGHSITNNGASDQDGPIKTGSTNESTWFFAGAFLQTTALSGSSISDQIQFRDGASVQCTVGFRSDGAIVVYSGTSGAGTLIATFAGAFVANSFDHYNIKVVIHNTTGSISIKKNRLRTDATIDFQATGLNTRGGTANNYANAVCIRAGSNSFVQFLDDTWFYNGNVAGTPNDWIGDVRAIQMMTNTDTAQKQFAQNNTASLVSGRSGGISTQGIAANFIQTQGPWTANSGGTFTTATVDFNAGFTGNAKLALYLMDGLNNTFAAETRPGTLIGVSNAVVNPGGVGTVFTFASAVVLMKGFKYCFALLTDAAYTAKGVVTGSGLGISSTYSSGFPASLSGTAWTATLQIDWNGNCTVTLTNAGCTSDEQQDGVISYLSDGTVGDFDLCGLNPLSYTPAEVIGVALRSFVAKSDATARGFKITAKSGATSFDTAEYLPLVTFANFDEFRSLDPNTGAAWVPAALNSLQIGGKVSS